MQLFLRLLMTVTNKKDKFPVVLRPVLCALMCGFIQHSVAQIPANGLDVTHYLFQINLNDSENVIYGKASITTTFTKDVNKVVFDLAAAGTDGKGMKVSRVLKNGLPVDFVQDAQHLTIMDKGNKGKENLYQVTYSGIPSDGLIISNTQFGNRSFFADNWPNRAHNWIPCNDHLSDKATVEFVVIAPDHYQVISNGKKIEETQLSAHRKLTHWKEDIPLPTKVMVIGATDFAVNYFASVGCIPVSSWIFPGDKDNGFASYSVAKKILSWYIKQIGPYPFEKLANVQSKTIFGGMENASCIFYFENSVHDKGIESLMAHEIAHQWFGDNVTEKDWPHLWLSEGFATYMTDLYLENEYGIDSLQHVLSDQRKTVLRFAKNHHTPVVDTSEKNDLMKLLNANSYQKGAWVLHMLRRRTGDSLFWKSIRKYYKSYAEKNAGTKDLEHIFEKVSTQNLQQFFRQWLYTNENPDLKITWYADAKKILHVKIEQLQKDLFQFPLEIKFGNGHFSEIKKIEIASRITEKQFSCISIPEYLTADPNVNLLFKATVNKAAP